MSKPKSWREVVKPHPDVAAGRYRKAEFAADLAKVARGEAEAEYGDPREFYQRTYLTHGMERLLVTALKRLSGTGGEATVQLKTAFGGGKTHTMLTLFHLFSGTPISKLGEEVRNVLEDSGLKKVPRVRIVVIVGSDLDPTKPRAHPKLGGAKVRTIWGELAAQIGGAEAFEMVAEADRTGTSPGRSTLAPMLTGYGPCLILIDELVGYTRNLYGQTERLSGGTFDSVLTFVHNLSEAVAHDTKNSMIVASIPESDIEIGGEGGRAALERLEHTFARTESPWSPVGKEEGFEIVRRRLFGTVEDEAARDETCKAFQKMYRDNREDFPAECREKEYLARLQRTYPIHPEIFDRLYGDWTSLERFQKTRGVLRFMATVIHELWKRGDESPLIMPGTIPLNDSDVSNELLRYLPEVWRNVVDTDIDGDQSSATFIDGYWPRIGSFLAARKVARSIFLGSAPSVREQRLRGIEKVRILLGTAQPDEPVAVYGDALNRLLDRCTFLYVGDNRLWYDTRPSLGKTVRDRASQLDAHDVTAEVARRLHNVGHMGDFARVHPCPASSADVPDDDEAGLVILSPQHVHRRGEEYPAQEAAKEILQNRGTVPRMWRNMLIFLAPDQTGIENCFQEVRRYLAWQSVKRDARLLNLDVHQMDQVEAERDRSNSTVDLRLNEAYSWLFFPSQSTGTGEVEWNSVRVSGGQEPLVLRVSRRVRHDELLIPTWSAARLKMDMDRWNLWGELPHLNTKKLWEYLCTYLYLPRLKNQDVLHDAIREGVASTDFFGYAAAVGQDGRYQGLVFGKSGTTHIDGSSIIIRPEVASKQLETDMKPSPGGQEPGSGTPVAPGQGIAPQAGSEIAAPRRFWATAELEDPLEAGMRFSQIIEGILEPLRGVRGSEVKVRVEVEARSSEGFPDKVRQDVSENCRTTKMKGQFEKE